MHFDPDLLSWHGNLSQSDELVQTYNIWLYLFADFPHPHANLCVYWLVPTLGVLACLWNLCSKILDLLFRENCITMGYSLTSYIRLLIFNFIKFNYDKNLEPDPTKETKRERDPIMRALLLIFCGLIGGFILGMLLSNLVNFIETVLFQQSMEISHLPYVTAFLIAIVTSIWGN